MNENLMPYQLKKTLDEIVYLTSHEEKLLKNN